VNCSFIKNNKDAVILSAVLALIVTIYAIIACSLPSELGNKTSEDAYYNLLIKGFANGHLYLDIQPPRELLSLKDPYDPNQNAPYQGLNYQNTPRRLHDLSLYKGQLYLYFSVIPAILLFLPYHILTGHYLTHEESVSIFTSLAFLSYVLLFISVKRYYFPTASRYIFLLGVIALGLGNTMPILLVRADVWEVPIACANMCIGLGLIGLFYTLKISKNNYIILALTSLALGLAIASRPNLFLCSITLCIPIWINYRKYKKYDYFLILSALIPLCLIISLIFTYNFARFGNIFEFGQHYQLAGDRQDKGHFSIRYLWYNCYSYFLSLPTYLSQYNILTLEKLPSVPEGHATAENYASIFLSMPFTCISLITPWILISFKKVGTFIEFSFTVLLMCLCTCLPICLFYGTCLRYEADFTSNIVLVACITALGIDVSLISQKIYRLATSLCIGVLLILSVISNLIYTIHWHTQIDFILGQSLVGQGKYVEAKTIFAEALALNPKIENAYFDNSYGLCLYGTGELKAAEERLTKALTLDPYQLTIYTNLAQVLLYEGDKTSALKVLNNALIIDPNYIPAKNLLQTLSK